MGDSLNLPMMAMTLNLKALTSRFFTPSILSFVGFVSLMGQGGALLLGICFWRKGRE